MEENKMEQQEPVTMESVRETVMQIVQTMREEWQTQNAERMKLENMTDEQKTEYAMSQREKALQEREKKLMQRELKAKAMEKLQEKGLPKELADALPYESEAECLNAMDKLEAIFRKAVQQSVDEKLKGELPHAGTALTTDADNLSDQDYYKSMARNVGPI